MRRHIGTGKRVCACVRLAGKVKVELAPSIIVCVCRTYEGRLMEIYTGEGI